MAKHRHHKEGETHPTEKQAEEAQKSRSADILTIFLAVVVVMLLGYIAYTSWNRGPGPVNPPVVNTTSNGTITVTGNSTNNANVSLELFVMSHCPYGVQQEGVVQTIINKFNGQVNLSLHFIATDNGNGTFSSLHGSSEVAEDLRQACIMKYYPEKFLSYLSCIDQNYASSDQAWSSCASQSGIDQNEITQCSSGSEGANLLRSDTQLTNQMQVQSSPTLYLGGQQYVGVQSESQLTTNICKLMPGSNTCKNLPPEVSVGLTIVNDKSCIMCDTSQILGTLTSTFAMNNLSVTNVDYSSDQGKALLQEFNLTGVPAYIFNASIVNHSSYSSLGQYLHNVDSSYVLLVQPVKLVNVIESNNTLELFVMSWCPYGTMAEKALVELLNAMPGVHFIGVHFIASESGGTFTSLHGDGEVQEDLRQVCIMKYYNSEFFNYMLCIDANASNSANIWQSCASSNGVDVAKIGNCSTSDEGKSLLSDNIALSNSLGIQSSPTFVLNNDTIFNSVSADQLRQVICGYNPALEGCNKTLSGQTSSGQVNTPSGGCGS